MDRMDMTSLFASQLRADRDNLLSGLEGLLGVDKYSATLIPYASDKPPAECFQTNSTFRSFEYQGTQGGVTAFRLRYLPGGNQEDAERLTGDFFVTDMPLTPGVYLAATIEPPMFVRKALLPFVERNRPRIYLTFMRQDFLRSLLQDFRRYERYDDLMVIRTSFVARFGAGKGEASIPSVNWPQLGLDGAFSYADEQNGWFRSLTFKAVKNRRTFAQITIHRNGIVKTDGQFGAVFRNLVTPISMLIKENGKLFSKRGRRENKDLEVRPLTIEFAENQFQNIDENAKFIEAMRKLKNSSVSVLHGNPYIALSVVDYFDGSTFDLWVVNPRQVVLVPQMKGSIAAIKRIISHVFDKYAEGTVLDYQVAVQS